MTAPPLPGRYPADPVIPEAPTAVPGGARVGNQEPRRRSYRGKRLLDLVVVSLIIVPAALLCAIAALAHLLAHGRPVLFRQQRVGRDGSLFVLLKLRTMVNVPASPVSPGDADTARVTAVGRVLRRMSLDELPQLVNVLRGQMSLVGPRPTLPYQVSRYTDRQQLRLLATPGLTGLAQVHGRQRLSWPERIEWDLRYVLRSSFRLDLAILFLTVWTVLAGRGATASHDNDPIAANQKGCSQVPDSNVRIRLASPDLGEEEGEAVRRVLRSGVLTNGAENEAFAQEFADRHQARFGVTFCTGTAALQAMLLAEGIGPGDEVIVPSMTFVSTATSVRHVGATPVFADIDPRTFNLDPQSVAARITPATRAVMTVHYAGQPGDLDGLARVCGAAGVPLLEDAAQAAGAEYRGRPVGTFGRSAMFSFTPTKNITTGEGGMVLTNDPGVAERLKLLRNHGQTGLYQHESLGYNWRLTEMQAAIGRVQLRKLDGILGRKQLIAESLTRRLAGLPGLTTPHKVPDARGSWMLYTCLLPGIRDQVLADLLDQGVEARIYFPPVHRQPIFARRDGGTGDAAALPVTEAVARAMLSLPVHHRLTEAEVTEIADAVTTAVGRATAQRNATDQPVPVGAP